MRREITFHSSDPERDPIAQNRADHRAGPGWNDADVTGSDHRAQCYQQKSAGDDEGNPDK